MTDWLELKAQHAIAVSQPSDSDFDLDALKRINKANTYCLNSLPALIRIAEAAQSLICKLGPDGQSRLGSVDTCMMCGPRKSPVDKSHYDNCAWVKLRQALK